MDEILNVLSVSTKSVMDLLVCIHQADTIACLLAIVVRDDAMLDMKLVRDFVR